MTRDEAMPRIPDLLLERYRLGELPPAEVEALEQRMSIDAELRERLGALERSDAEIRRRYPPEWLAARVRSRLPAASPVAEPTRPARLVRWPVPLSLAAVATLLMVLGPRLVGPPQGGPAAAVGESGDRIKGLKPALELFRKTSDGSETLAQGDVARVGDLVRIGYRAAGHGFGVIVSVDGRGAVTVHLPARGDAAATLESGAVVLLDQAYELDDAPRLERFYLVTADFPFTVETVVVAARRVDPAVVEQLPLSARFDQATFLLRKGGRP